MSQHTHLRFGEVDEEHRDAAIKIIDSLVELDATSDARSVTVERLQIGNLQVSNLHEVLDELVKAGVVRRIEYHPLTDRPFREPCRSTAPEQYRVPRYWARGE